MFTIVNIQGTCCAFVWSPEAVSTVKVGVRVNTLLSFANFSQDITHFLFSWAHYLFLDGSIPKRESFFVFLHGPYQSILFQVIIIL